MIDVLSRRDGLRADGALAFDLQVEEQRRASQEHDDAEGPSAKRVEGPLRGERFVFTGTLTAMSRSRAERLVASLGAEAVSSVTRKVTHPVAGADPGAKLARAEGYEIDVMDEAAFLSLLREHGVEPDA